MLQQANLMKLVNLNHPKSSESSWPHRIIKYNYKMSKHQDILEFLWIVSSKAWQFTSLDHKLQHISRIRPHISSTKIKSTTCKPSESDELVDPNHQNIQILSNSTESSKIKGQTIIHEFHKIPPILHETLQ